MPPSHQWAGYIPFDQLPQAFDPPDGVLATANARVTPDGYRYPITLDWKAPYRTERIYKVLEARARPDDYGATRARTRAASSQRRQIQPSAHPGRHAGAPE